MSSPTKAVPDDVQVVTEDMPVIQNPAEIPSRPQKCHMAFQGSNPRKGSNAELFLTKCV